MTVSPAATSSCCNNYSEQLSLEDVDLKGTHTCVCSWKSCRKWQVVFAAQKKFHNPLEIRGGNCINLKFSDTGKSAKFSAIVQRHLGVIEPFPLGKQIYVARHHWRCRQLQRFDAGKRPSTTVSQDEILELSGVTAGEKEEERISGVDMEATWAVGNKKEYFMAPNVPMEAVSYAVDCILASMEQQPQPNNRAISPSTTASNAEEGEGEETAKLLVKENQELKQNSHKAKEENAKLLKENQELNEKIDWLNQRLGMMQLSSSPPTASPTTDDLDELILATLLNNNNKKDCDSHLGPVGSTSVDEFVVVGQNEEDAETDTLPNTASEVVPLKRQKTCPYSHLPLSDLPVCFSSSSSLSEDDDDESFLSTMATSSAYAAILPPDLKPAEDATAAANIEALISNNVEQLLDNSDLEMDNDFFAGAA